MADFTCRRCGECCGPAYFTRAEYKAVQRTAKNMGITLVKQYVGDRPFYLPRALARKMELPPEQIADLAGAGKMDCPFLGRDKAGKCYCRIYNLRPEICRLFGTNPGQNPRLKCPNQERNGG
jgi:Fe-S-cluster containining protein